MNRSIAAALVLAACLGTPGLAVAAPSPDEQARLDYAKADQELNRAYDGVMHIGLDAGSKKKLVAAELAWIKYRDAEASFAMDFADAFPTARRYRRMAELTRERTKVLWDILNEANGD